MIKERTLISGDLKSKVKQLMEYAGWYEGRKVDISIAEQYYADHGVPMMKTVQRFYRKYFGLCCEWYLEQRKLNWPPVSGVSLSVISATTTRQRFGSPSTGNCMRNMSIRMRLNAFPMCSP